MNISVIKRMNEALPYWVKRPFARMIRGRLVNNKVFLQQYETLVQADSMSKKEVYELQLKEIKQVLIHAYAHTKYYKELFDQIHFDPNAFASMNDLKKIPILTKALLKSEIGKLETDDISNYYHAQTSGSTGQSTTLSMEKDAIYREWAFVYHYWSKFGYDYKTSKLATFRGVDLKGKLSEINPLYQEIRLNVFQLNRNNIREYILHIERYGADFIYGYPSSIYNLCRLCKESGIDLKNRFKAVLLISENLYDFQEKEICEVLACPIAMFYGHTERAAFAERYNGGYVFHPLYGVVEIGENNAPIATGFINGKTPLIRYEVDDSVELLNGGKMQVIGHKDSSAIYGKNEEQIGVNRLAAHGLIDVPWFRFVQELPGELTLQVREGSATPEELDKIRTNLEERLSGVVKIGIELVDESDEIQGGGVQIPDTPAENTASLTNAIIPAGDYTHSSSRYKITGHRESDILYGRNGEQISPAAINFHDCTFSSVHGYQFIQKERGICTLLIVPDSDNFSGADVRRIERNINTKLGSAIKCSVKIVDEIPLTARGKYKMVIQNIKNDIDVVIENV